MFGFPLAFSRRISGSGGGGGADAFSIGGASPELVAAFTVASDGTTAGEYFRKASSETTFGDLFTFSRSGLATQFDSGGNLVWAPHNYIVQSNDLDTTWTINGSAVAPVLSSVDGPDGAGKLWTLEDDDAGGRGQLNQPRSPVFPGGSTWTYEVWFEKDSEGGRAVGLFANYVSASGDKFIQINTQTGAFDYVTGFGTSGTAPVTVTEFNGLWRVRFTMGTTNATAVDFSICPASGSTSDLTSLDSTQTGTTNVGYVALYRSDLGGMADNPDQPAGLEKYVPTTSAAVYLSRRNAHYYNSAWVKGGLQLEAAAATNLVTYSRDLTNAAWTAASGATVAKDAVGIDGAANSACTVTGNGTSGSGIYEIIAIAADTTTYTFSVFLPYEASPSKYPMVRCQMAGGTGINNYYPINTTTGVATLASGSGGSVRMTRYGNWWRFEFTIANANNTDARIYLYPAASANGTTIDWTQTGSLVFDQAEIKVGSVASSPIITTGSTIARAAETLSIAGADTPANTTAMSISMKGLMTYADTNANPAWYFYDWSPSTNDRAQMLFYTTGGTGGVYQIQREGGNALSQLTGGGSDYAPGVNVPFRLAARHTNSVCNFALQGVLETEKSVSGLSDLSAVDFDIGTVGFDGFITEMRLWGADIGDSGIEEVTS
jgi:hypothetical protein